MAKCFSSFITLIIVCPIYGQTCDENELKDLSREVFSVVEQPPYLGTCTELVATKSNSYECSDDNLMAYLREKGIINPDSDIPEELIVEFIVEQNGCINNIKVLANSTEMDNSTILSIFRKMPAWTPGQQKRKTVRVRREVNLKTLANGL